jgi:hypothetical protein
MAVMWELYGKGFNEALGAAEKTLQNRRTAQALGGLDLSTPDGALQASKALIGMGRTQEGMTLAQLAMQERNRREELGLRREDIGLRRDQERRQGEQFNQQFGLQNRQFAQTQSQQERMFGLQQQQANRREVPPGFELTPTGMRPIAGGPADPSYRKEVEKSSDPFQKANIDRIGEMRTAGDTARETLGRIAQLEEARKQSVTGTVMRVPGLSNVITGVTPGNQTLDAIAAEFTLGIAEKMKGALSDKDVAFLGKTTPGSTMSDEGAAPIIAAARAGAERMRERAKFYETWYSRNKTLEGADDAWDKFLNEKPILSTGKNGQPEVNRANITAWKEYVATNAAPARGARPQQPTQQPAQAPQGAPQAQSRVIGPAPQGATEGRTGTLQDGRKVIVRNGQIELAQ